MEDGSDIRGDLYLGIVNKETGATVSEFNYHNTVCDQGKVILAHRMCDTATSYGTYSISKIYLAENTATPISSSVFSTYVGGASDSAFAGTTNYLTNSDTQLVCSVSFDGAALSDIDAQPLASCAWATLLLIFPGDKLLCGVNITDPNPTWNTTDYLLVRWTLSYS